MYQILNLAYVCFLFYMTLKKLAMEIFASLVFLVKDILFSEINKLFF